MTGCVGMAFLLAESRDWVVFVGAKCFYFLFTPLLSVSPYPTYSTLSKSPMRFKIGTENGVFVPCESCVIDFRTHFMDHALLLDCWSAIQTVCF